MVFGVERRSVCASAGKVLFGQMLLTSDLLAGNSNQFIFVP